jgi:hypothetical protein
MHQASVFEQLLTYVYFENGNQSKYSLILTGLITHQYFKNYKYPKTMTEANNVLSIHKFDGIKLINKHQNNKALSKNVKKEADQEKS